MFAGFLSFDKPLSMWGQPERIATALAPYSTDRPRDYWATDKHMLLQVATRSDSESAAIYRHVESGVAVAFWGRLDNRTALISQLNSQQASSDEELIVLAWLKWGEYCPEKLDGDFAIALISERTQTLFLMRDRMGIKPLYYRLDGNGLFFANSVAAFKPLALGKLTPSNSWTAKFLIYRSSSQIDTAYEEIKKLPPAHSLIMHGSDGLKICRYHQFIDDAPRASSRNLEWLEAYKSIWQESVSCRIPKTGLIGCENSGGIDSGSITTEVARLLGNDIGRLSCFGFCREQQEPAAIMSVAMKFGIANNFLNSRPYDHHYLPRVIERSLAVNGYPIEIGVTEDHDDFYRIAARQGVATLFSGFGGDELVTSENMEAKEEFLDAGEYRNLFQITPGDPLLKLYRTGKFILKDKFGPKPLNYDSRAFQARWPFTFFTDEAEAEYKLRSIFIGANDYVLAHRKVNALAMTSVSLPHMAVRVENGSLMASSHGLEYVWPLLDYRLIQQWFSTPTIWKVGGNQIFRYLHRRAVDGVCPDQITWKSKKDMGGAEIRHHFEMQSNRHHFQQLLNLAEDMPVLLSDIVDIEKLRKVAKHGLIQDSRGYEVFSALIMLNWNLQALVAWGNQLDN